MNNEMNIKIYRDGRYSVRDNLEFKAQEKMGKLARRSIEVMGIIDYYFANHRLPN